MSLDDQDKPGPQVKYTDDAKITFGDAVDIRSVRELEALTANPDLVHGYTYWRDITPTERTLPGRQHFDPVAVPRLLKYVLLLDVLDSGHDLRVRLAGTATRPIFGRDPTGVTYRDLFGEAARDVLGNYRHVIATRLPSFRAGRSLIKSVPAYRELERIIFPLAADGERVDIFLTLMILGSELRG